MKKTTSVFLVFVILLSCVSFAHAADKTVYTLSLDDAIEMALNDNDRLIANSHKQHGNKVSIESARLTRKPYKDMAVNVTSNFELYCMKEGYYIKAAEMAYRLSVLEESKIKSDIAYDVTNAYYSLVLSKKLVSAAQNAYNLALENQKIVDKQYELGYIALLDYENASLATMGAKSNLDAHTMNLGIAEENLKILLDIEEPDAEIVLTDEIECDEFTSDASADAEKALETRYDLEALRENAQLSYEYFDLSTVLTENSATYNNAYASYLEAQYNYTSTKDLIGLSIKSSYNNIITSSSAMEIAKRQYEIKLREHSASEIKYTLGVISNIELTKAINDLYEAQVSYANAKLSYRMAIEKYKYEITTGL